MKARTAAQGCEHRWECEPAETKYDHYRGGPFVESTWDLVGAGDLTEDQATAYHAAATVLDAAPVLARVDRLDRLRLAVRVARAVAA